MCGLIYKLIFRIKICSEPLYQSDESRTLKSGLWKIVFLPTLTRLQSYSKHPMMLIIVEDANFVKIFNERVAEGVASNLHDFIVYISWWQIHCTYLPPCRNHDNKQAVSCTWKPKVWRKKKNSSFGEQALFVTWFFMYGYIGKMSIAIIFWGWEVIAKVFKMVTR